MNGLRPSEPSSRANQAANQRSVGTRSANSTRSGGPPLATRSKAATRSGHAQTKGQRLARTDREGGGGALVGVADDAAPIEDEAGIGQGIGETLDAGLRPDRHGAGSARRPARPVGGRRRRGERQTPAKTSAGLAASRRQARRAEGRRDRGDQPARLGQPPPGSGQAACRRSARSSALVAAIEKGSVRRGFPPPRAMHSSESPP